jgi:hypothetical protein
MDAEKLDTSAMQNESAVGGEEGVTVRYSPEEERLAVRKLDWTLIPVYL